MKIIISTFPDLNVCTICGTERIDNEIKIYFGFIDGKLNRDTIQELYDKKDGCIDNHAHVYKECGFDIRETMETIKKPKLK